MALTLCATPMAEAKEQVLKVRLTYYSGQSKWGRKTSTGKMSQHLKTCAVDPKIIPYGSTVKIPSMGLTLKAVDTGPAVVRKTASRGKLPIVDIFVNSQADIRRLNSKNPNHVTVYITR